MKETLLHAAKRCIHQQEEPMQLASHIINEGLSAWTAIVTTGVKEVRSSQTCICGCAYGCSAGRLCDLFICSSLRYATLRKHSLVWMSGWELINGHIVESTGSICRTWGQFCYPRSRFVLRTAALVAK